MQGRGRERGRDRESQAGSVLSTQNLMLGSIPRPLDHDLSLNQELDTQLTEPPRCPEVCFCFTAGVGSVVQAYRGK